MQNYTFFFVTKSHRRLSQKMSRIQRQSERENEMEKCKTELYKLCVRKQFCSETHRDKVIKWLFGCEKQIGYKFWTRADVYVYTNRFSEKLLTVHSSRRAFIQLLGRHWFTLKRLCESANTQRNTHTDANRKIKKYKKQQDKTTTAAAATKKSPIRGFICVHNTFDGVRSR